jgi:D-3-phosphoglycerate dehydrogenase
MTERVRVFVTQPIDEHSLAALAMDVDVVLGFGADAKALDAEIESIDGILVRTERLTAQLIGRAGRLRAICRVGIGLEKIDVTAATAAGIPVFNTAGANAHTVAELTFGLALAVARQIPRWDAAVRTGGFARRNDDPGFELHGKTWGVIGLGNIGHEVANTARLGFGMRVLAYHPSRDLAWVAERGAEQVSLDDLLSRSDFVSVHVPKTEANSGLISASEFARMRRGAVLINMSRGGVVNEEALVNALRFGPIAGAGIDVFDDEPPSNDHPLFTLTNVVLSPHRGGRTREATEVQGRLATAKLLDVLGGGPIADAVNAQHL